MEKSKKTIVTNKVKSNAVDINKCIPLTNEELTEIIECSQLGKYNFINVTLKHVNDKDLAQKNIQFANEMREQFTLVLLQKEGLYEKRYTIVTNKPIYKIVNIISNFQAKMLHETNDHRFEIKY